MGEGICGKGYANCQFFFRIMAAISEEFPVVFNGNGINKPHSQGYRDFSQKWSFIKTLYEVCDEDLKKVGEVYQSYLSDFFQLLTFLMDKQKAEDEEDKFQQTLRKAKKGK